MAFSRITITFNEDLSDGDNVFYSTVNPLLDLGATWVTLRSNAFEVTTATPTGNAGEASAIAYKNSFELDYDLNNFIIEQAVNVITVTLRNETQTFLGGTSNKDVDFVIDTVPNIPVESTTRINVRSPYFLYAPIDTGAGTIVPDNVVFNLFVWSGDIVTDKPTTASYVYQKNSRFLNDDVIYIEVSKQIQDFIQHTYTGTLGGQSVFASWEVTTTYSGGDLVSNETVLAFDGYNNHFEGVNYIPANDIMISNRFINHKLNSGFLNIPFYKGNNSYSIEQRSGTSVIDTDSVDSINITDTSQSVEVLELDIDGSNIDNIKIVNEDTLEETIIDVEEIEECIYEPVKCVFVNSDGVLQEFWFFKASREDLQTKDETYRSNVLNESIVDSKAVLSYSTSRHLNQRYNTQGNRNITLNTGYINEDNNELIEELLLSENIWLTIDDVIKPVDITDKSLSYLTKRNDQLIRYTLKFAFSYDQIQNIR